MTILPSRRSAGQFILRWSFFALVVLLAGQSPGQDGYSGIPTLRVYTNLVQIPTLVLDRNRKPIPALAERRFQVSIDSGPKFRATHVRVEGDDLIALAILVDVESIPSNLRPAVKDAIAKLLPNSLHAGDSVSVHVLQCGLSRIVVGAPLTPDRLRQGAELLSQTANRVKKAHEPCSHLWNLRDSMLSAVQSLQDTPGRRVLLVLSDGEDYGSRTSWDVVRTDAQQKGVAIFGLADNLRLRNNLLTAQMSAGAVCEGTGGILLNYSSDGLESDMRTFIKLVRSRYIVEFPRPAAEVGTHSLEVTVDKLTAFILPAGDSLPMPDPALAKDPNTFLPDPANAPELGTKQPKL